MKSGTKKLAIGTLIAAGVGYLAGLLTAPKSGKETREDIKDAANTGIAETEKRLKKIHTELNDLLSQAKDKGNSLTGKAKGEYDKVVDSASSVKQKVRELISAVHEGEANDRDLQRALNDGSKAVKHLRDYLKK